MTEAAAGGSAGGPVMLKNGQVIQNYEIVKPLGKGKFSIVYMAKRLTDNSMCALKKINIFDMMVPKQREKCLKEVRLLQSLDHPNIVNFKDSFIDNNELLIIVEWAEKGDLKRLIRRAASMNVTFRDTEIWEYSRQLASALEHMHQKRIMHRDLKPANIFVSMDGSLKLGDLGLGRFFSSQTLEAFSKVGTPLYMSPEVLRGAGYDMRSDVWSLGCVLYELAMLRSPFKSEQQLSLYDLFVRISKGEYPPLPETISSEFREVVGWMLALDPEKRLHCAQVLEVCNARMAALTSAHSRKDSKDADCGKAQQAASSSSRVSRPSPLLVMDDIVEKLKLLECEEQFLRPRGFPILHRCFFAQKVALPGQTSQFEVMYELVQWLLGQVTRREAQAKSRAFEREEAADASAGPPCKMQSESIANAGSGAVLVAEADAGAGDAAAGRGSALSSRCGSKGDPADLIQGLVTALAGRGIQISADATLAQLRQGHGEGVCLILNELINQELVGRDFHFEEPSWGEAPIGAGSSPEAHAEEVEEDVVDSGSEGSQGAESEVDSCEDACFESMSRHDAAILERSLGAAAAASSLEVIHEAKVDPEAWRAEVERVKPLLKMSTDALHRGGWHDTISKTRELCGRIDGLCPSVLADGIRAHCSQWQREMEELRGHEERLNARFSETAAETAQVQSSASQEREAISTLQASVTNLSELLSNISEELEKRQAEAANQTEVAMDAEKLPNLKKAIQRVCAESGDLEIRIGCVQAELTARKRWLSQHERAREKPLIEQRQDDSGPDVG
jgi:NIMA (never in mitosis gene a)-related kinase